MAFLPQCGIVILLTNLKKDVILLVYVYLNNRAGEYLALGSHAIIGANPRGENDGCISNN